MAQYNRIVYFDAHTGFWTEIYRNKKNKVVISKEYLTRNNLIADLKYRGFSSNKQAENQQGEKNNYYKVVTKKKSIVYGDTNKIIENQRYVDRQLKKWNKLKPAEKKELDKFISNYTYEYKKDILVKKSKQTSRVFKQDASYIEYDQYPLVPIDVMMINTLNIGSPDPKVYLSPNDYESIQDAYEYLGKPARTEVELFFNEKRIRLIGGKKIFKNKDFFSKFLAKKLYELREEGEIDELEYKVFRDGEIKIKLKDKLK